MSRWKNVQGDSKTSWYWNVQKCETYTWRIVQVVNRPGTESSKAIAKRPCGKLAKSWNVHKSCGIVLATDSTEANCKVAKCASLPQPAGRFTPKFACMRILVPDVSSPLSGVSGPGEWKRGKWNFCYYRSRRRIFAFWQFLSDIWATRGHIHAKFYTCRDNVFWCAPSPVWSIGPWGRGRGVKNSKKWGWSFVLQTATISIFLSVAICGSMCRAQTCAHSGVGRPKRSYRVGQIVRKKFRIFHHFETLRPYISETIKIRGI